MGTGYGRDLRQRGKLKNSKTIPISSKGAGKINLDQIWFDFTAAGTPPKKVHRQPNALLVSLWKALQPEQFRPAPCALLSQMPCLL